jgi:hypothetical protein
LQVVAAGLSEPVDVAQPVRAGPLLVVQRTGVIQLIDAGRPAKPPFADLRSVVRSNSIEQGLLGIAFHPRYPDDRRVFLFHSLRSNDNVLVSYEVAADGRRIEPTSRQVLLTVDKESDAVRHNAGALRFAPDGFLWIAVGDAARASLNGQNPRTLPGSILRIDVDRSDGGRPYAIPPGNPFADGVGGRPEVWWYGLRNPWRFTIDAPSGLAYLGDVGQETFEEIDAAPIGAPGLNFGWPLVEGNRRFYKGVPATPLVAPIAVLRHSPPENACSITGGEVYRGTAIPELDGVYLYADWCLGWIRSLRFDGSTVTDRRDWSSQLAAEMVSSFGRDADGEILVVDHGAGTVSRIVAVR